MKPYKVFTACFLFFSMGVFLSACLSFRPIENHQAFRNGQHLADKLAKQDAIDSRCIVRPGHSLARINLNRHLKVLVPKKHPDFIWGFKKRYLRSFELYFEAYCQSPASRDFY